MGLYVFKYNVDVTAEDMHYLETFDIEQALASTLKFGHEYKLFGKVGNGAEVTNNVFIIRANNYKECMDLILQHKQIIESSAWRPGTFGGFGNCCGVEKFGIAQNKVHTMKCIGGYGVDVIVCYKVPDVFEGTQLFFDAMRWAKSCKDATMIDWDASHYANNIVYK